ncbi:MAG TPA: GNAT family N-acetyltransferase [Casimicrobiaceae bacterium]|nr:GNAT family N-acetyltransferase [Casimicrobiaceae bacterium]
MDMLVRLYALPDVTAALAEAEKQGVTIRRPEARERDTVLDFVRGRFTEGWANECIVAFAAQPVSCFIAVRDKNVVGFACHDCTRKNFFGPAGVDDSDRGQGVGAALTLATLAAMRDAGYAYAIIGGVGPTAFYAKVAGARRIQGSTPGIYEAKLRRRPKRERST